MVQYLYITHMQISEKEPINLSFFFRLFDHIRRKRARYHWIKATRLAINIVLLYLLITLLSLMANGSVPLPITKRFEGKVALITGGSSGIGEYTARMFVKHGAKVVIADIQDELGHAVVESLGKSNSVFVHCDVTNEDHVKHAVDKAVLVYGKLDIMFNNAGISDPMKPRIVDNLKSDFERVIAINVTGVFLGMKHAARVMVPARKGCIISTCSVSSATYGVTSHAYCTSKHAVLGLTKNLAVELGQFGIRVNCLSPHLVMTPLVKEIFGLEKDEDLENIHNQSDNLMGATLTIDDVANAVLYLASDEAKYVSGHNLTVDGGFGLLNSGNNIFKYPDV